MFAGLAASAALAAAAVAPAAGVPASPQCAPAAMDASARLTGSPLLVTPAPGSRDAMPQTQVSLLGAPASQISVRSVIGSVTGPHLGRLAAYSQGDGASFVPDVAFVAGETVTVAGGWSGRPFSWSFVVGVPDPIARLPLAPTRSARPGTVLHFVSAPRMTPASLTVTVTSATARRDGDIFTAPYPGPGRAGPAIFDPEGRLVWFDPLRSGQFATNLRVQRYRGRPVLTWWQGTISRHGFGLGEGEIYSTSYRRVAAVRAGDGLAEDLHELQVTPAGTALITAWKPLYCDLSPLGGSATAAVYDACIQEIDIATGLVMWEWDSLEHLPLTDTYMPVRGASAAWPYDWFHLNSIALGAGGAIVISARSTWALYELDPGTGQVEWEVGGRDPTFSQGAQTTTAWQHDAREVGPDTYTAFDNGGPPSTEAHSRGVVLHVDPATRQVSLVESVVIPTPIFAQTQGNLERLPDGNWWIGWGNVNESSEVTPGGRLLLEAHTPAGSESYRTLRYPWSATAPGSPQIALRRAHDGSTTVYASWNGATAVARWRLEVGATPRELRAAGSVARSGFESVLRAPGSAAYVAVIALGARGRALGSSRARATH